MRKLQSQCCCSRGLRLARHCLPVPEFDCAVQTARHKAMPVGSEINRPNSAIMPLQDHWIACPSRNIPKLYRSVPCAGSEPLAVSREGNAINAVVPAERHLSKIGQGPEGNVLIH